MQENIYTQKLENEITELGNNLAMIESLVKMIDVVIDDELNLKSNETENILVALKRIARAENEQFTKIEKMFCI